MAQPAQEARQLGRYSLIRKIATGGMGEVHLARLNSVQGVERLFAIKLLLPQFAEEQSVVDMFVTEARIAARIMHTNVCQVFELGIEEDELFICMEYLQGVPATSILKNHKPMSPVDMSIAVAIVQQAAAGLQFAHDLRDEDGESLGVVHRDISPGNIFITTEGSAKVLDFGVVKAKDSSHKTKTGALKGKFGYMSPEQIMAEPLDHRSDVFSLGIVLFELLTNRRLFTRESEYGTLKAITESPIPTLASFRPDLPVELGGVLAKALSRDLSVRYGSMKEFSRALSVAMKPHGGIADSAKISDYIQTKFATRLNENTKLLQDVQKQSTPSVPILARKSANTDTTALLDEGISHPEEDTTDNLPPLPLGRKTRQNYSMAVAVGIVGLGVVALAAVLLLRQKEPAPVAGIVYEGQLAPEKSSDVEPKPVLAADASPVQTSSPDARATQTNAHGLIKPKVHRCEKKASVEAKNRCYVAAEGRKLTKCLQAHATQISGTPQMVLSFDLDSRGKVVGVSVSPSQFANTVLGTCVKSVAKRIKFGPQNGSVRFRIPLKINQK